MTLMTPQAFITKWSRTTTKERAAAQEHFIDLCKILGEKTPNEADPVGEWYAFEKGVEKTGAGRGWADVWKKGHFGWEYKSKSGGRSRTMAAALSQLQLYALALESPPLLIVSDIDTIEIHTAFQNAVQEVHVIRLKDLGSKENMDCLRSVFSDPEKLRPSRTRDQLTAKAAGVFAQLAYELRGDGRDPQSVAHFVSKLLFCMFSEDVGLLERSVFTQIVNRGVEQPEYFEAVVARLFQAMQQGGPFGTEIIAWFNGGLFDDDQTVPLNLEQIRQVRDLAQMDWSQIEPVIFGTLFERGLDPAKRSQLGAHYTDLNSIMRLIKPTIIDPLLSEWTLAKTEIAVQMERMESVKSKAATLKRLRAAADIRNSFLEKLRNFRVLDPACGSGNFLYVALLSLKDIEHQVNIEAEALGLERQNPMVGPEAVMGIELNGYAAELAKVTMWIGEIQWMLNHGYALNTNPILKNLQNIERRDALIQEDGTEASWPRADVIIGNPPFLGGSKMLSELGFGYVTALRKLYKNKVPGGADLVTYWYELAHRQIEKGLCIRAGLVATNSIRGGSNRTVLDRIVSESEISSAWSDEPWVTEGAAVRVSLVVFNKKGVSEELVLDGYKVSIINSNLTSRAVDITKANKLAANRKVCCYGSQQKGSFEISEYEAKEYTRSPNPNNKPNSEIIRRSINARRLLQRELLGWVIDFGRMDYTEASLYELPFGHLEKVVKPAREAGRDKGQAKRWWQHARPSPNYRKELERGNRVIVSPAVSKHRIFVWLESNILADHALLVFCRSDDVTFGILHSKFHELWTLATCTWLGKGNDPRYTPSTTFDTFPFPDGLSPNIDSEEYSNHAAESIEKAAKSLVMLRDSWLNPKEWTNIIVDDLSGYPDRVIPQDGHEDDLRTRSLTNLYNEMPSWLRDAHRALDYAVADSYGWPVDISDQEILENLLELNQKRESST